MISISKKLYALRVIKYGITLLFFMVIFGILFDFTPKQSIWVYMIFSAVFITIRTYELKLSNELFAIKTFYNVLYYAIGFGLLLFTVYYLSI